MARILVVDDDGPTRTLIKAALYEQNHAIDEAEGGEEAIDLMRGKAYDLVIMDRNMPLMDGIQTLAIMRTSPMFKNTKVVMCTGSSLTKEVDEAFAAGACDYILKPINLQVLVAKVKKALGA